jgi:D-sedoheptulose 7-phosphate isomerase
MTTNGFIQRALTDSIRLKTEFFSTHASEISAFCELLKRARQDGKKVLIFGNGGSAADAQHFAAELMHKVEHHPLLIRAQALHTDTSLLTAYANDENFDHVYSHQIEVLADPGDIAVAISTSGKSANIVEALRIARKKKCKTVGLLGRDGGSAKKYCDLKLIVSHSSTPRIQEVHGMLIHVVCQWLEQNL